jgi:hypothetical protein
MTTRHRLRTLGIFLIALAAISVKAQDFSGTVASAQFDLKYPPGVAEPDARRVSEFLNKRLKVLHDQIGLDLKKKIEVRVYESVGRYLAESGAKRPWRAAIYAKGILHVQPVSALAQRKLFEQALSYELAIALLEQTGDRGCPLWLREAFAVYQSGELARLPPPPGDRLSSFSDLNQDIQDYAVPPQRDDVHFVLGQTMTFFIHKYGEQKSFALYKTFDGSTSVEQVFKKVFEEEYAGVEKQWAKYIASRAVPMR